MKAGTSSNGHSWRQFPAWILLAFSAGMVNGFAFLACHEFVTHMTGTITRSGLEWKTVSLMFDYLLVVSSFVLGAATSTLILRSSSRAGSGVSWNGPLSVEILILTFIALVGYFGAFGVIPFRFSHQFPGTILLSCLAFTMGVQNAAIPLPSGLGIRTTHLSGHVTNLGIHLATAWMASGAERRAAIEGILLRGGKILGFAMGAVAVVPLMRSAGFISLLAPAICVLVSLVLCMSWGSPPKSLSMADRHAAATGDRPPQ